MKQWTTQWIIYRRRLIRPVCRGFSFFWPPKEHNRNNCQQIGNNWPRVKYQVNITSTVYCILCLLHSKQFLSFIGSFYHQAWLKIICPFCADKTDQKPLRMGRFLNAKRSWWFLGARNDRASEYNASSLANCKRAQPVVGEANLTNAQTVLAALPKIIDAVWLKT